MIPAILLALTFLASTFLGGLLVGFLMGWDMGWDAGYGSGKGKVFPTDEDFWKDAKVVSFQRKSVDLWERQND